MASELRALQQPGLGYVAIFGWVDQHSAGAEGAPYRLSIVSIRVCSLKLDKSTTRTMPKIPAVPPAAAAAARP
eukprot:scaffold29350_cov100-Isochrysis_galbana.AAC.1